MSAVPCAAWEDHLLGVSETRAWPMRRLCSHWAEQKRSVVVGRPELGSCMEADRDPFDSRVVLPCSRGGPWQTRRHNMWRLWRCGDASFLFSTAVCWKRAQKLVRIGFSCGSRRHFRRFEQTLSSIGWKAYVRQIRGGRRNQCLQAAARCAV